MKAVKVELSANDIACLEFMVDNAMKTWGRSVIKLNRIKALAKKLDVAWRQSQK